MTYGPFDTIKTIQRECQQGGAAGLRPVTSYTFDAYRRLLAETTLEGGTRFRSFNGYGEVASEGDSLFTHTYVYDKLSRLLSDTTPQGLTNFVYDTLKKGLLTSTTSADNVTTTFGYDGYLRLLSKTFSINGQSFQFSQTYDGANRVATETYPGLSIVKINRGYDTAGHLLNISRGEKYLWRVTSAYAPGQLKDEVFGDPSVAPVIQATRTRYPLNFRLQQHTVTSAFGNLLSDQYTWTQDGDLRDRIDVFRAQSESFTYDVAHQLKAATISSNGAEFGVRVKTAYRYSGCSAESVGELRQVYDTSKLPAHDRGETRRLF